MAKSTDKFRRETNAERVKRLTDVAINAGEGVEGQAAVREEVNKERAAQKKDSRSGVFVDETSGNTVLLTKSKGRTVGFEVLKRPEQVQAERARQIAISERLNRGEVLTARDLLARGGSDITTSSFQSQTRANIQNLNVRERARYERELASAQQADREARIVRTTELFYGKRDQEAQTPQLKIYSANKLPFIERKIAEFELKKVRGGSSIKTSVALFAFGAAKAAKEDVALSFRFIKNPFKTSKELGTQAIQGGKALIKQPSLIGDFVRSSNEATLGATAYNVASPIGKVRILKGAKELYVVSKAPKIAASSVIDIKVLKGQSRFPFPESSAAQDFAKAQTKAGEFTLVSAGPSKYPGLTIKAGAKAQAGMEDAGLFTTPKGRASAYFLRAGDEAEGLGFTFNPVKPYLQALETPSVTEFTVSNVRRYPKSVLSTKGFEKANQFAQQEQFRGSAFITKRSTTGKSGRRPDTRELEAIIPAGSKFYYENELAGYTRYKGQVVAIRKARVLREGDIGTSPVRARASFLDDLRGRYSSSAYSSSRRARVTPYSFISSSRTGAMSSSSIGANRYKGLSSSFKSYQPSYNSYGLPKYDRVTFGTSSFVSPRTSRSSASGLYSYSTSSKASSLSTNFGTTRRGKRQEQKKTSTFIPIPRTTRAFRYTPSAYAAGLGIRGRKNKTLTFSGLGVRPI
jgi:hypothetical protein